MSEIVARITQDELRALCAEKTYLQGDVARLEKQLELSRDRIRWLTEDCRFAGIQLAEALERLRSHVANP